MDKLLNLRTFLAAARLGSFAAAARSFSISPSVVSKRINQLEHEFNVTLFRRSTRELRLTADGARLLPRCMKLVAEYDDMRLGAAKNEISGLLRVDAPGSVTAMILGPIFCDFLALNPAIDLDLRLTDRLDNPLERTCDLTIGTRPSASEEVRDFPLMPYPCAAFASRDYLARRGGGPAQPRDLAGHDCLVSLLHGRSWHFYGEKGDFGVTVNPRLAVNDTIVLREAVRRGAGDRRAADLPRRGGCRGGAVATGAARLSPAADVDQGAGSHPKSRQAERDRAARFPPHAPCHRG